MSLPMHDFSLFAHTRPEVTKMKKDEKAPIPWEAVDPKPPIIRSGHMENRKQNNAH